MILVACEVSQRVTQAFRDLGYPAISCDILPTEGEHPYWHYRGPVENLLDMPWHAIIAFPPCTHLSLSGADKWKEKQADGRQQEAFKFFKLFAEHPCHYTAVENPVGWINSHYRKPDQIIQPYWFGDSYQKRTCLWLKNLPPLEPTNMVDRGEVRRAKNGKTYTTWFHNLSKKQRAKIRGITFPGVAKAMAEQWGKIIYGH